MFVLDLKNMKMGVSRVVYDRLANEDAHYHNEQMRRLVDDIKQKSIVKERVRRLDQIS